MKAFQIEVEGRRLDYRVGQELDRTEVRNFFGQHYEVKSLTPGGRHVTGFLEKDGKNFFLKLSTTEGISALSQSEAHWNDQYNTHVPRESSDFWVPCNIDQGFYRGNLFYLVTDIFEGKLLADRPHKENVTDLLPSAIPQIIDFSEMIAALPVDQISTREDENHQRFFLMKTESWFQGVPENVRNDYNIEELLEIVRSNYIKLEKRTRHGDFTPWHLMRLEGNKLALIDGEHAMRNGVEYYDIAYFIQRVFSVLENPELADDVVQILRVRNYDFVKLQTVLAARAIGGFLDESLKPVPDYFFHKQFQEKIGDLSY